MKVNNPLNNILNSKVKIECLRHLCSYPTELNGRQLSRFLKITPKSIHKAMSALVDEGVVNLNSHGNSFGYSINKEKWITKRLLLPLFQNEKTFLEEIIREIKKGIESSFLKKNILSVVLFGSVQKKEDSSRSDFDIFILADKESNVSALEEEIEKVGTKLTKIYGVTLGPYVKSISSFKKDRSLNVIKSILSSYQLIYGQELTEYVR
jgi:predicted nucleotidyltransferase